MQGNRDVALVFGFGLGVAHIYLLKELSSYINGYLIAAELLVTVLVDQLEDVRLRCLRVANVDQFHLEHQRCTAGNHFAGAAIAVAQRRRNGELALLA